MQPSKRLKLEGGIGNFLSMPEMGMGVQFFEGELHFLTGEYLPAKALLLSTRYVLPIVDQAFQQAYRQAFYRDFFDWQADTTAFSCIHADSKSGWALAWDDGVTDVGCEGVPTPNLADAPHDQQSRLLMALISAFSATAVTVPAPGASRTLSRTTTAGEGFLRFSFHVPDPRVDSVRGIVQAMTFCSPYRDGQKITSGFEAVGRFALPVPLPYSSVVLLMPPPSTPVDIGTVVPNFGQAGGGVEALFPNQFTNLNLHYHVLPAY